MLFYRIKKSFFVLDLFSLPYSSYKGFEQPADWNFNCDLRKTTKIATPPGIFYLETPNLAEIWDLLSFAEN